MEKEIRQHNAITEARYEMSALEKDIVYLLMCELKQDDIPQKEYSIEIANTQALKNVRIQDLRQAARNLLSRVYYITKPNGNILAVTLMTVAAYDQNEGKMRIRISQKLLPYLIALRDNFTQFQLKVALNLRSKYSKRLYEMLSQHKEAGGFSISVDELKWRLELIEAENQPGKYIHFNALKRRVLEVAQRELDKYADITFSYEAIKTGRKYTDLTFRIYPNKNIYMHGEKGAMSVQQEQNLSLGRKPFIHSGITLF